MSNSHSSRHERNLEKSLERPPHPASTARSAPLRDAESRPKQDVASSMARDAAEREAARRAQSRPERGSGS